MRDAPEHISGIGLSAHEQQDLIHVLEEIMSSESVELQEQRLKNRYVPLIKEGLIEIEHASGGQVRAYALLCDLGRETIELVTRAYIHLRTSCTLWIQTHDREKVKVTGHVLRCDYYGSRVHKVSIRLLDPIDPRNFVSSHEWARGTLRLEGEEWVRPRSALLVEPDDLIAKSISTVFDRIRVSCHRVNKLEDIQRALDVKRYDLLVCSSSFGSSAIESSINGIPDPTRLGHVTILDQKNTSMPQSDPPEWCEGVFELPVEFVSVLDVLRLLFGTPTGADESTDKLIHTVLRRSECRTEDLNQFLLKVQQHAIDLEAHVRTGETERVRRICASLHASSPGFGYPALTQRAAELAEQLQRFHTLEHKQVKIAIERLLDVIARLRGHKDKG